MKRENDKPTVLFMLAVMTFAVVLVPDPWARAGLSLLPALLLAQRALSGVGIGVDSRDSDSEDRRNDMDVRDRVQELLKLIREFYATCHMVAVGQAEPSKAKAKAQVVERRLNLMMADILKDVEGESTPES